MKYGGLILPSFFCLKKGPATCSENKKGLTFTRNEGPIMKAFKHNPHPVDMNDFYHGQITIMGGKDFESEEWDEELTDAPSPLPTIKTNLLRLRRSVSEKLFSIEFGRISF